MNPLLKSAAKILVLALTVVGFSSAARADDPALAARLALRKILVRENAWLKVHAAEVLIAHGEGERVRTVFLEEVKQHGGELRYRNGIWRVLVQTARTPAERSGWLAHIEGVALNPASVDRLHAVESLAKLGGPHSPAVLAATKLWLKTAPEEEAVYAQWLLWQAGDQEAPASIGRSLQSSVLNARLRAAFVLRRTGTKDAAILAASARAADGEPSGSVARAIVVGSAYVLRAAPARLAAWRELLEQMIIAGPPGDIYEALQGLMPFYRLADLTHLLPLLHHQHPDVRTAAAWAILNVTAREASPP
jgi:hypothetical protein